MDHSPPCTTLITLDFLHFSHTTITMDKLSGLASKLGGKSSHSGSNSGSGSAGQEDYVDKGENHCAQLA
jgi:hypothetical protein